MGSPIPAGSRSHGAPPWSGEWSCPAGVWDKALGKHPKQVCKPLGMLWGLLLALQKDAGTAGSALLVQEDAEDLHAGWHQQSAPKPSSTAGFKPWNL